MILIDEKPLFDEEYDLLKARLFEDLSGLLSSQFQERGGFVHLKKLKELIVGSGDAAFRVDHRGAWAGAAIFTDAPFSVDMNGLITCSNIVITGGTIDGVVLTGLGAGSEIAIQGWQHDMAFSATDHDTVAWATGTITLLDGTTYSITGDDTGTMSAITYIYLDIAVSTTTLRTTDTPATAVGSGKILIAVAQNVASGNSAIFQVFGGKALGGIGKLVVALNIAANVITGNEIYGNALSVIFADMGAIVAGTITLDASGFIKGGQTAFDTGIGFWLGYDTDAYKFSIGNPAGHFLTWDGEKIATNFAKPVIRSYVPSLLVKSSSAQFDISNPSGTTFRYTYDGNGTDPGISATTVPVGSVITIYSSAFNANNNGAFTVTGSGTNYFEVTNASGVAESNKILGESGYMQVTGYTWTKPAGLRYIMVELVGAGGGGGGNSATGEGGGGGGAGGYSRKYIPAADLGATETVSLGLFGFGGAKTGGAGVTGGITSFGAHCQATGGAGGTENALGGAGGVGSGGDLNINGVRGGRGNEISQTPSGAGGPSYFGGGGLGRASEGPGEDYGAYGSGGGGAQSESGADQLGGAGGPGIIYITEFYT